MTECPKCRDWGHVERHADHAPGRATHKLTDPQRRALLYLAEHSGARVDGRRVSPADLARHLWPDSDAYNRRTRFMGSNHPGQTGGTMPMNAARLLHRLARLGYARNDTSRGDYYVSRWHITDLGNTALGRDGLDG